jgi:hypothetical protein
MADILQIEIRRVAEIREVYYRRVSWSPWFS